MNPLAKTAADRPSPGGQADGGAAANRLASKAPVILAAVLILSALGLALWFAQIRADNRAAEQLCQTVSLLVRDNLTRRLTEDPAALGTADFAEAGSLDGIALPAALSGEAGRKVNITVDTGGTPYAVAVQVQGADGAVAAGSRFTAWPLADQTP